MKPVLKHVLAAIILGLGLAAPVAAGPLEDADAAYRKGDHAAALRVLRPPANQGDAVAQFNLGVMYDNGHGVPQDHVLAYMWFNLSAAQGNQLAAGRRDRMATRMTPAQIAKARKLAREWRSASP
jgi:TPR repeat protein